MKDAERREANQEMGEEGMSGEGGPPSQCCKKQSPTRIQDVLVLSD